MDCVGSYAQRQQALREQVRRADHDAALLFAAHEIAEVRALADQVRRGRARRRRHSAQACPAPLERYQQMRLEEYHASLSMLRRVAPRHGSSGSSPSSSTAARSPSAAHRIAGARP